jgi:hypothetical protein
LARGRRGIWRGAFGGAAARPARAAEFVFVIFGPGRSMALGRSTRFAAAAIDPGWPHDGEVAGGTISF